MGSFKRAASGFALALVAVGCSTKTQSLAERVDRVTAQSGQAEIVVQRGAENQAMLKVVRSAQGRADLALVEAQGYVEAQDRFFQMDTLRRVGRGRLSELFGVAALPKDVAAVAVGLRMALDRKLEVLIRKHPDAYQILQAYADGVNRFLESAPVAAPALLQQYRAITKNASYVPDAWEPADSLAIAQNIAFYLSSSLQEKLTVGTLGFGMLQARAQQQGQAPDKNLLLQMPGMVGGILDLRPLENTFILESANTRAGKSHASRRTFSMTREVRVENACHEWGFPFPECKRPPGMGSNNFVVSRQYAGGDAAYVANDPHLPLTLPMQFYELSLDSQGAGGAYHVRGVNLPGIPLVLIGHNDKIAWAMTNLTADVDDIYLETLDATEKAVVFGGKTVALDVKLEKFGVRNAQGGLDVQQLPMRWVPHHGPVFSDYVKELAAPLKALGQAVGGKAVASYRWTGHEGTMEFAALVGLNRARNYVEFKAALDNFGAGAQNMIYADGEGNIGYYAHGDFPVRKYVGTKVGQWAPYLPTPGSGAFEWQPRFRADYPETYNPASGRIVTANNDPYGQTLHRDLSDMTDYFGYGFADGARATRITEKLESLRQARGGLNLAALQSVQTDHVDLHVKRLVGLLAQAQGQLKVSSAAAALLGQLVAFDGDMSRNRIEPVLADAWLEALGGAFIQKLVPVGAKRGVEGVLHSTLFVKTLYHTLNDHLHSADPSQALQVLGDSLEAAAQAVNEPSVRGKRWGEVHTLTFSNALAGLLPAPKLPELERDGYYETVDVAGPGFGPNFRLLMTVKNGGIEAEISVPGGNYATSDPKSLVELTRWRDGGYRPLVSFASE